MQHSTDTSLHFRLSLDIALVEEVQKQYKIRAIDDQSNHSTGLCGITRLSQPQTPCSHHNTHEAHEKLT